MSSSAVDAPSLNRELKYHACAVLVAFGVAAFLAVCFWRLYRLTVSARPEDMLPISSSGSGSGTGKKAAALRQSDISALPVFVHGSGAAGEAGTAPGVECAVCLAEMRDGERGRLLPGCRHRFHVECIDRWFRVNSACPLCRVAAFGEPSAVEANKGGSVAAPVVLVQS